MFLLKVSKDQNDFIKTSFLPKTSEIILRISLDFGKNDVFIKSLNLLLTFDYLCLIGLKTEISVTKKIGLQNSDLKVNSNLSNLFYLSLVLVI